jgi:hypothetical protein
MTLSPEDAATLASDMREIQILQHELFFKCQGSYEYAFRLLSKAPDGVVAAFKAAGPQHRRPSKESQQLYNSAVNSLLPAREAIQEEIRSEVKGFLDTLDSVPQFVATSPNREVPAVVWSEWLDKPTRSDGEAILDWNGVYRPTVTITGRKTGTWYSPEWEDLAGEYEVRERVYLDTTPPRAPDGLGSRSQDFWRLYGTPKREFLSGVDVFALYSGEKASIAVALNRMERLYEAAVTAASRIFDMLHLEHPKRFPRDFSWMAINAILEVVYRED